MRFSITFILVCCSVLLFSQEVLYTQIDLQPDGRFYQRNHQEPFTGTVVDLFSNEKPKLKAQFKDGLPNGKYEEFYEDGAKKVYYKTVNGQKTGKETQWYPNGQVQVEIQYINGLPDGAVTEYYDNGKVLSKGDFAKGKETGEHKWFFRDGTTDQIIPFVNGKADGLVKRYYAGGELKFEKQFSQGLENGASVEYAQNGNKIQEGVYVNGKEDGIHKLWAANGQLLEINTFDNGTVIKKEVYRSAELTIEDGYKEVYNEKGAFFTVDVTGKDVQPYKYDGLIFLVDNQVLELSSMPKADFYSASNGDLFTQFLSYQKQQIEYSMEFPEGQEFNYIINKPFKSQVANKINLQIASEEVDMPVGKVLKWSFEEPEFTQDRERQRMLIKSQHFYSIAVNDYIFTVSGIVTDKYAKSKEMHKMLQRILNTVKVYDGPIEITQLSKEILKK